MRNSVTVKSKRIVEHNSPIAKLNNEIVLLRAERNMLRRIIFRVFMFLGLWDYRLMSDSADGEKEDEIIWALAQNINLLKIPK
jgi:hypothetical protein